MTVYFIGAGPGDPDLITVKGQKLISQCPVCIYAGSLVPEDVITSAPEDALVMDSASMNLEEIMEIITKAHNEGKDIARVHS
ncbi:MAG: precorrin-4 C(11)-methyltransferase, partial [Rhodobacteraceae bacterium]|nr:precorrin-4 C(11)-methyltransferase [Paracoccaceae bacterium]